MSAVTEHEDSLDLTRDTARDDEMLERMYQRGLAIQTRDFERWLDNLDGEEG